MRASWDAGPARDRVRSAHRCRAWRG